jgi:hypothetical protein
MGDRHFIGRSGYAINFDLGGHSLLRSTQSKRTGLIFAAVIVSVDGSVGDGSAISTTAKK